MLSTATYQTLFPAFDMLQSERLIVRPYQEGDAQALFEAVDESREHLLTWIGFANRHQTIEQSQEWINRQRARWILREEFATGLWERATERYLGDCRLYPCNWESRYFTLGYWLRSSATGKGYITEAVRLLVECALTTLAANRLEIQCDEQNTKSAAVAKRLGFVLEGRLRNHELASNGSLRTSLIFSLIPTDVCTK